MGSAVEPEPDLRSELERGSYYRLIVKLWTGPVEQESGAQGILVERAKYVGAHQSVEAQARGLPRLYVFKTDEEWEWWLPAVDIVRAFGF